MDGLSWLWWQKVQGRKVSTPVVHVAQGRAPDFSCAPNGVGDRLLCDTVPASLSSAACGQRVLLSGEEWNTLLPWMVSLSSSPRSVYLAGRPCSPVRKVVDVRNVAFEKVDWGAADKRRIVLPALTLCCGACHPVSERKLPQGE